MAKGKVNKHTEGGSRAAKKRRKQKEKAAIEKRVETSSLPQEILLGQKNNRKIAPQVDTRARASQVEAGGTKKGGKNAMVTSMPPDNQAPGGTTPTAEGMNATVTAGNKRKRLVSGSPRMANGQPLATSASAPSGGAISETSNSASRRSQRANGERTAPPTPAVIDASDADDRSQLLLELDAKGVLSDHDVESGLKARQLLQWMVAPLPVEEFHDTYWEKNAFVVRGRRSDYFAGWLETSDLESFVSTQSMQYGVDLDVTNYVNKRRITLNPAGPGTGAPSTERPPTSADDVEAAPKSRGVGSAANLVSPKFVWEKFRQGCSLRMPCPQKFSDPLHRLLAALEEEFGCMVGSNVYLTPPRSQGFAPHWDDIEAFLLQVEGRKRWRVYPPASESASLPRVSSPNLTDEEAGEVALEVVLEPGDILYFPRGWIHQAETVGDEPSLHITVSVMQGNCWADLIEDLVPQAVASAVQAHRGLRSGLPRNYLDYMGVVHSDETEDQRRASFKKIVREHLGLVVEEALELLDAAADQMGKRYISDRLPPVLEDAEEAVSVVARGDEPITPLTKLRMARRGCARLLLEDGVAVVYHCMDNSRVHHGSALSPLQFELDDAPAIEVLLAAYPEPVRIYDLPHPPTEDLDDKVGVATALYKEGFLLVAEEGEDDGEDSSPGGESIGVGTTVSAAGADGATDDDDEGEDEEDEGL